MPLVPLPPLEDAVALLPPTVSPVLAPVADGPTSAPPLAPVVVVLPEPAPPLAVAPLEVADAECDPDAADPEDPDAALADEADDDRELICDARLLATLLTELATLTEAIELLYALSPVIMNSPLEVKSVGVAPDCPPAMAMVYRPAVKFRGMTHTKDPEFWI